ncbi:MAG: excinuclease ABC subunit UvrA [Planctomycetes bacterium]|nr:excinuclease ABC subunit UvrA [Planctomycetota bacterium]
MERAAFATARPTHSAPERTEPDSGLSEPTVDPDLIVVKGAREHNLRNVTLSIPRGKLVCFTGVSGSGKSSFAFDTLFAEGQRRYLESLSSYARQFLGQLSKPDVDQITGLGPAIAIQQKTSGWNPRSTVGTITQIHDYLRVLFARAGRQHCPRCARPIAAQTREQILARILEVLAEAKVLILGPVVRGQKGEYRDLFADMIKRGFARARVDGEVLSLAEAPMLARHVRHNIEIVVDRLTIAPAVRPRLAEAVETALELGDGTLIVHILADSGAKAANLAPAGGARPTRGLSRQSAAASGRGARGRGAAARSAVPGSDLLLSSHYACPECDLSFEPPSPQLFSFNSPTGMCTACDGLGTSFDFDPDLLVPDPRKSFLHLAVEPMRTRIGRWRRHIYRGVAEHVGFDLGTPWGKLPEKARRALLYGLGDTHVTYEWRWSGGVWRHGGTFAGVVAELRDKHRKAQSSFVRAYYEKYMRQSVCGACRGGRLNAQALAVRVGDRNINEVCALPVNEAEAFFAQLSLSPTESRIAAEVLKEIRGRLRFLTDVGLEYLTLDRSAPTLSGGESQRIRLASQIGAGLVGVLYVLDEPSIGLHHRDNRRLLDSLRRLRDLGNTVVVVEHDEQTMRAADEIVDFGPGPGVRGGEVVAHGSLAAVAAEPRSITGRYLRRDEEIPVPQKRRPVSRAARR